MVRCSQIEEKHAKDRLHVHREDAPRLIRMDFLGAFSFSRRVRIGVSVQLGVWALVGRTRWLLSLNVTYVGRCDESVHCSRHAPLSSQRKLVAPRVVHINLAIKLRLQVGWACLPENWLRNMSVHRRSCWA